MTPLPPELRERLRPVLMLLFSPIEGEARGAIEAIKRLLVRYSLTASDFADHVAAAAPAAAPPAAPTGWGVTGRELSAGQLSEIIVAIRAHGRLTDRAREFLIDLEARTQLYPSVRLSPKQHDWLLSLAETAAARMPS